MTAKEPAAIGNCRVIQSANGMNASGTDAPSEPTVATTSLLPSANRHEAGKLLDQAHVPDCRSWPINIPPQPSANRIGAMQANVTVPP